MKRQQFVFAGVTIAVSVAILFAGRSLSSPRAEDDNDSESKVQKGFAIAPVPLNLAGKNRELVGNLSEPTIRCHCHLLPGGN